MKPKQTIPTGPSGDFQEHRSLLFAIAYRMLGSVMDAEDIVQECFITWQSVARAEVENPRAFLRTMVTRKCLDELRSARVRRETYVGEWLPEPLPTRQLDDPVLLYEDRESLSMAFLILLESLNPVERAVYLLREIFDVPFEEIAVIVEKSADNCRQILHRARQAVGERRKRYPVAAGEGARLLGQFLAACTSGDVAAFTDVLVENIQMISDGGGKVNAAINVVEGLDRVARFFVGVTKKSPPGATVRLAEVNGETGLVLRVGGRIDSVTVFDLERDAHGHLRIARIYGVRNPDKLAHLGTLPGERDPTWRMLLARWGRWMRAFGRRLLRRA